MTVQGKLNLTRECASVGHSKVVRGYTFVQTCGDAGIVTGAVFGA